MTDQSQQEPQSQQEQEATPPPERAAYNLLRLGFFAIFFSNAFLSPFTALLFESRGFSAESIGYLNAVNPLCVLFVLPPLAYIAETRNIQSQMLYWSLALSSLFAAYMFTAEAASAFYVVVVCCYFTAQCVIIPIYDEHVICILGPEKKSEYGAFRVFGAYSWAISAVLASLIFGHFGFGSLAVPFVAGFAVVAWAVYKTPVKHAVGNHNFAAVLRHVVNSRRISIFLVGLVAIGSGYSVISSFLFLFLQNFCGAPPILFGLSIPITVIVEIPIMRKSKWLHERFTNQQLFLMAVAGFVFRVVGYSYLENPWLVLLLEPAHGLSFAMAWLAGISLFSKSFPAELQSSAVGLVHSSYFGLGPLITLPIAGRLYDTVGPREMFRIFAVVVGAVGVIFFLVNAELDREEKYAENREELAKQKAAQATVKSDAELEMNAVSVAMPGMKMMQEDERDVASELRAELPAAVAVIE